MNEDDSNSTVINDLTLLDEFFNQGVAKCV